MSEENTQTVTEETDGQAKPDTEETGAQEPKKEDDLETLLSEYEQETGSDSTEQKTGTKPDQETVSREELEELRKAVYSREYQDDLSKAIKTVRGDLDSENFDDAFMDAWLNARAKEDSRVANAWLKRHENPKGFARVLEGLGKQFTAKYGKLGRDESATEDREAVAAAVRGATGKAPEGNAPDYSNASNAEFRDDVKKRYGINIPV